MQAISQAVRAAAEEISSVVPARWRVDQAEPAGDDVGEHKEPIFIDDLPLLIDEDHAEQILVDESRRLRDPTAETNEIAMATTRTSYLAAECVLRSHLPGTPVVGYGDHLSDADRVQMISTWTSRGQPFIVVNPNVEPDLLAAGKDPASTGAVAMYCTDDGDLVVGIATGAAEVVARDGVALMFRPQRYTWEPISINRLLPTSEAVVLPTDLPAYAHIHTTVRRRGYRGRIISPANSLTILKYVILGGVPASLLPSSPAWSAVIAVLAAAVGQVIVRTNGLGVTSHGVRKLLFDACQTGEKVPNLVIARHEFAGYGLLSMLTRRDRDEPA